MLNFVLFNGSNLDGVRNRRKFVCGIELYINVQKRYCSACLAVMGVEDVGFGIISVPFTAGTLHRTYTYTYS